MFNQGCLMMDIEGVQLQEDERDMLRHPLTGGVILFSRNFEDSTQLRELIRTVRESTNTPLIVATDHEGGRVQRFRTDDFSIIPAMGAIEPYHRLNDQIDAIEQNTRMLGWLMASECLAHDIDLSFAPVLDLNRGSDVVGDRAFHQDIDVTSKLASYWCNGVIDTGMKTVGKHFPGHGSVKEDSHIATPVDERSFEEIENTDLQVFSTLISQGLLHGMMPAHVRFPKFDELPAGYSVKWIRQILQQKLGFNGVLFSDDLSMVGAGEELSYTQRAQRALSAGCHMVLACNNKRGAAHILDNLEFAEGETNVALTSFYVKNKVSGEELKQSQKWQRAVSLAQRIKDADLG